MIGSGKDPDPGRRSQELCDRARRLIPGGTQLFSKRPELFLPGGWPGYAERASGVDVWDVDGRHYVDVGYHGIGACTLGYADPDVDGAVIESIKRGSMTTLNCPEEIALAERLIELHPWADMVRFARSGGEAMAVAVRIARAHTGRERIAFSGYHGWHDWYLAANLKGEDALSGHLLPGLSPRGVPKGLTGTALPFRFNRPEELEHIVQSNRGELAAVVLEPVRAQEPTPAFLAAVAELSRESGAVLVVDEITAGFRFSSGGAHLHYGFEPDMAVFAKAISNGYPMAAILGRAAVMEAAQDTFISSTSWTERTGPTAALATIGKHEALPAAPVLERVGLRVRAGWEAAADAAGLSIGVEGIPALSHFHFDLEDPQAVKTLFVQMMLDRGFLATTAFYASVCHTDEILGSYLEAIGEVFRELARTIDDGRVRSDLRGPVASSGFGRLT